MAVIIDGTTGISSPAAALTTPLPVASGGTGASSLSGLTVGSTTNLANGSAGTVPYQSASGATAMLAVGTAGQVLQTNGAGAPTWVTPGGGSWTYLSTVTASGSSTVDIETTFDSTYDEYVIKVSNFIPDTSNESIRVRVKVGGTYDTGSNYGSASTITDSTGATLAGNNGGTAMLLTNASVGASRPTSFEFLVHSPASTSYAKGFDWSGFLYRNGVLLGSSFIGAGLNSNTSTCTGIRFYMSAGLITSGTFRLYGIKKS